MLKNQIWIFLSNNNYFVVKLLLVFKIILVQIVLYLKTIKQTLESKKIHTYIHISFYYELLNFMEKNFFILLNDNKCTFKKY